MSAKRITKSLSYLYDELGFGDRHREIHEATKNWCLAHAGYIGNPNPSSSNVQQLPPLKALQQVTHQFLKQGGYGSQLWPLVHNAGPQTLQYPKDEQRIGNLLITVFYIHRHRGLSPSDNSVSGKPLEDQVASDDGIIHDSSQSVGSPKSPGVHGTTASTNTDPRPQAETMHLKQGLNAPLAQMMPQSTGVPDPNYSFELSERGPANTDKALTDSDDDNDDDAPVASDNEKDETYTPFKKRGRRKRKINEKTAVPTKKRAYTTRTNVTSPSTNLSTVGSRSKNIEAAPITTAHCSSPVVGSSGDNEAKNSRDQTTEGTRSHDIGLASPHTEAIEPSTGIAGLRSSPVVISDLGKTGSGAAGDTSSSHQTTSDMPAPDSQLRVPVREKPSNLSTTPSINTNTAPTNKFGSFGTNVQSQHAVQPFRILEQRDKASLDIVPNPKVVQETTLEKVHNGGTTQGIANQNNEDRVRTDEERNTAAAAAAASSNAAQERTPSHDATASNKTRRDRTNVLKDIASDPGAEDSRDTTPIVAYKIVASKTAKKHWSNGNLTKTPFKEVCGQITSHTGNDRFQRVTFTLISAALTYEGTIQRGEGEATAFESLVNTIKGEINGSLARDPASRHFTIELEPYPLLPELLQNRSSGAQVEDF